MPFIEIEWIYSGARGKAVFRGLDTIYGEFTIGWTRVESGWPVVGEGLFEQAGKQGITWLLKTIVGAVVGGAAGMFAGGPAPTGGGGELIFIKLNSEVIIESLSGGEMRILTLEGTPEIYYDQGNSKITLASGEMSIIKNGVPSPPQPFDIDAIDRWWESLPTEPPGEEPLVCQYAGADERIDGADMIQAIQDYARGDLNGAELIQVIQYYASGTSCDQSPSASTASGEAMLGEFSVEGVGFTRNRFMAQGVRIAGIDVQVYDLAGQMVFSGSDRGNTLAFHGLGNDGRMLANGIYLYIVTAFGPNGESTQGKVHKLVILR